MEGHIEVFKELLNDFCDDQNDWYDSTIDDNGETQQGSEELLIETRRKRNLVIKAFEKGTVDLLEQMAKKKQQIIMRGDHYALLEPGKADIGSRSVKDLIPHIIKE